MARVKLIVNKEDVAPEHHALFDELAALRSRISGPSTIVLHSPGLARPWNQISEYLHRDSIVEPEHAELAARGHRVTGVDFAAAMIAQARGKATERGATVRFEEADAEQLPFGPASFDLVISRHVLWTLPHPPEAIGEWIRVLRPGGRLVVVDSQFDAGATPPAAQNARTSPEYAAVGDRLPFMGGRPREEIEALLKVHGLVNVATDPLIDLVAAQEQRMLEEGHELTRRRRYVVWGDVAR